jgi:molybdopterin-guanine dinucleotide biosynthesis protein A
MKGFVFAGGSSTRMGRSKAEMRLVGKRLADIAANILRPICTGEVEIVQRIRRDDEVSVVTDKWPAGCDPKTSGPMVALYTAFSSSTEDWIAVLACDLPLVTVDLIRFLAETERSGFDAVVPVQSDGWPQPLCALYRREACLPIAERMLIENELSLQTLLWQIRTRFVPFDEFADLPDSEFFFLNLNTPEDHAKAEHVFASRIKGVPDA